MSSLTPSRGSRRARPSRPPRTEHRHREAPVEQARRGGGLLHGRGDPPGPQGDHERRRHRTGGCDPRPSSATPRLLRPRGPSIAPGRGRTRRGALRGRGSPSRCGLRASGIDLDDRGEEPVAALGHGLDHRLPVLAQGLAHLPDALDEGITGDRGVGPQAPDQLVLGDEAPGIADEMDEDVERLRPQRHDRVAEPHAARPHVEREAPEPIGPRLGRLHVCHGLLAGSCGFPRA
jgi:hypothetical protein